MKFIYAIIFFVVTAFLSTSLGSRDWGLIIVGLATLVGFLLGKVFETSNELKKLRQIMADDWENRNSKESKQDRADADTKAKEVSATVRDQSKESIELVTSDKLQQANQTIKNNNYFEEGTSTDAFIASDQSIYSNEDEIDSTESMISNYVQNTENKEVISRVGSVGPEQNSIIKQYFTGGNIFVRVGIIILFFGVSFLLKYVSDQGYLPIEYRLIGVVLGAMCLLGLGWYLRHKNEIYALTLQGAGIGILYLDIFAAYNLYQLIPPLAAFTLLFVVSMFSAVLAVLQNSKSLAVLGFSGGFIAPILVSNGSNNHVGLFSYYAILNVSIVVISWFKAWRELNLLGFVFTFIIGTTWGALSYSPDKFLTTEPFLILFFIFYVLIAVFYALRQPSKLKGYVDGTLLFGVPLVVSSLQYILVKEYEYGVSISSFAMGVFYILLSGFIWKRRGESLKLLSEAFLAIGIIFASLAIPFALAPTQTAAAWALEGVGLIWLGTRQDRVFVRLFGVLLQIGAGVIFMTRYNIDRITEGSLAFVDEQFLSSMMLAVAGIVSARLLIKPFTGQKMWESIISPVLLAWGLIWLMGDSIYQLSWHFSGDYGISPVLLFISTLSVFLGVLSTKIRPVWNHAFIAAFALFIIVFLIAIIQLLMSFVGALGSSFSYLYSGLMTWVFVFVSYYFLLFKAEKNHLYPNFQRLFHTILVLLIVAILTDELVFVTTIFVMDLSSSWIVILYVIPSTLMLWMIMKLKLWPFTTYQESYKVYAGSLLAFVLTGWSLLSLFDAGISDPLPWVPIMNPLDIMVIIIFITLLRWWQSVVRFKNDKSRGSNSTDINQGEYTNLLVVGFAMLIFLWLNVTLFRIAHHWFATPYKAIAMYESSLVQTSVSILWALTGVVLTLYASHRNYRFLWVTGAFLLGLVVLKLFVIDLSALSNLARIISFLVVGLLLTSIGYFAPIPNKGNDKNNKNQETL